MNFTIISANQTEETKWRDQLNAALLKVGELPEGFSEAFKEVRFVDAGVPGLEAKIDSTVFLILPENSKLPLTQVAEWIEAGKIADVLVAPFRPFEVLNKLRQFQQIKLWKEVSSLNTSLSEVIARLQEDLQLAERLQKSKVPHRFPDIKGLKVSTRYLAGMKSGGDHFDLAEAKSGNQLSIVLSDSSSYGLSSAVLSILIRVAVKLTAEEVRSCEMTAQSIQEELLLTLSDKDRLSLFYATISRKDYRLRYVNLGSGAAFYAAPKGSFTQLTSQGGAISRANPVRFSQNEIELQPSGRLILLSDGFMETAGSDALALLNGFRDREPTDLLNELVFKVKEKFTESDDMPAQDCTAAVFDVDAKILRSL